MKATFAFIFLFFFFISVAFVPFVRAEEGQVSITDFPQQLANALDTTVFVGGLLATVIFLALALFPSLMIVGYAGGDGQAVTYTALIVGLPVLGVAVGAGWLPVWIFIVTCLVIALMFSGSVNRWITRGGSKGD